MVPGFRRFARAFAGPSRTMKVVQRLILVEGDVNDLAPLAQIDIDRRAEAGRNLPTTTALACRNTTNGKQ
jgi:hypothetical protein